MSSTKSIPRLSYLIRLWAEPNAGKSIWRFGVVLLPDTQVVGFSDLKSVCTYLEERMEAEEIIYFQQMEAGKNKGEKSEI